MRVKSRRCSQSYVHAQNIDTSLGVGNENFSLVTKKNRYQKEGDFCASRQSVHTKKKAPHTRTNTNEQGIPHVYEADKKEK